jgi:hypothetical protein
MTRRIPWADEPTPVLPHLASEFLLFLWWSSENPSSPLDLGEEIGSVDLWVDTRISFKTPGESKAAAVLTGENPSAALEARAAVAGGKVPQELRFGIRRGENEFFVTLRAPSLDFVAVQLPQVVQGGGEEALYDRMFLFEDLLRIVRAMFVAFSHRRAGPEWEAKVLPALRAWIAEGMGAEPDLEAP